MGSTNPLRDVTIQVAAEAAVCPLIQRQQVTIQKKYAIVVACKVSGQGINEYVQTREDVGFAPRLV